MTTKPQINAGLKSIQEQGQGIMQVSIAWREDGIEMAAAALLGGDPDAVFLLRVAAAGLKALARNPKTMCLLCDDCPKEDDVRAICAWHAMVDDPDISLCFIVCMKCGDRPRAQTLAAVRDKIVTGFTNVRPIDIQETGGNA